MIFYLTPVLLPAYLTARHMYCKYQLKQHLLQQQQNLVQHQLLRQQILQNHPYYKLRGIETKPQIEKLISEVISSIASQLGTETTPRAVEKEYSYAVANKIWDAIITGEVLGDEYSPELINEIKEAIERAATIPEITIIPAPITTLPYDLLFKVSIIGIGTYDLFYLIPQPYHDAVFEKLETFRSNTKTSLIELKESFISTSSSIYEDTLHPCAKRTYDVLPSPQENFLYASEILEKLLLKFFLNPLNTFFPPENQTIYETLFSCIMLSMRASYILDRKVTVLFPLLYWMLKQLPEAGEHIINIINNTTSALYTDSFKITGNKDFQYLNYQERQDSEHYKIEITNTIPFFLDNYTETLSNAIVHVDIFNSAIDYVIYLGTIEDTMRKDITTSAV